MVRILLLVIIGALLHSHAMADLNCQEKHNDNMKTIHSEMDTIVSLYKHIYSKLDKYTLNQYLMAKKREDDLYIAKRIMDYGYEKTKENAQNLHFIQLQQALQDAARDTSTTDEGKEEEFKRLRSYFATSLTQSLSALDKLNDELYNGLFLNLDKEQAEYFSLVRKFHDQLTFNEYNMNLIDARIKKYRFESESFKASARLPYSVRIIISKKIGDDELYADATFLKPDLNISVHGADHKKNMARGNGGMAPASVIISTEQLAWNMLPAECKTKLPSPNVIVRSSSYPESRFFPLYSKYTLFPHQ